MALLGARHPGRTVAVLDSCFSYSVQAVLQPERGGYQALLYITLELSENCGRLAVISKLSMIDMGPAQLKSHPNKPGATCRRMLTHASFLTQERRVTNGAVTVTLLAAVLSTFQDLAVLISGLAMLFSKVNVRSTFSPQSSSRCS